MQKTTSPQDLTKLIENADYAAVRAIDAKSAGGDRERLFAAAAKCFRTFHKEHETRFETNQQESMQKRAALTSVLNLATPEELGTLDYWKYLGWPNNDEEDIFDWEHFPFVPKENLQAFVQQSSVARSNRISRFLSMGLVSKPIGRSYMEGVIRDLDSVKALIPKGLYDAGLLPKPTREFPPLPCEDQNSFTQALISRPDFSSEDIWYIFEFEVFDQLAAGDSKSVSSIRDKWMTKHPNYGTGKTIPNPPAAVLDYAITWTKSLVELAEAGLIDRARLLDEILKALAKDIKRQGSSWLCHLHEALKPTVEEQFVRLEYYLRCLASPMPATVSFAAKALLVIAQTNPIELDSIRDLLEAPLASKAKQTILTALSLLETLAERDRAKSNDILLLACTALIAEAPEVQSKVCELVEKYADCADPAYKSLGDKLAEYQSVLLPTTKQKLASWLKPSSAHTGAETLMVAVESATARTVKLNELTRIETLDDLLLRAAFVLENPAEVEEMELVIDGIARLGKEHPEDFAAKSAALYKRSLKLVETSKKGLLRCFAWFVFQWLNNFEKRPLPVLKKPIDKLEQYVFSNPFLGFFNKRLEPIINALANGAVSLPLLSAPTHQYGWLSPSALVDRLLAWKDNEIDTYDGVLALLRLNKDIKTDANIKNRIESLEKTVNAEFVQALAYALGFDIEPAGKQPHFWSAAARVRHPSEDDAKVISYFGAKEPDTGAAAKFQWSARKFGARSHLSVNLLPVFNSTMPDTMLSSWLLSHIVDKKNIQSLSSDYELSKWLGLLSPVTRQSYFAWSALSEQPWSWAESALTYLFDPTIEFGEMGSLLLVSVFEGGHAAIAQEVMITAIESNRLNVEQIGTIMHSFLHSFDWYSVRSTAKSLTAIARVSKAHATAVCKILQAILRDGKEQPPKDFHLLLELLRELKVELDIELDEPTKVYLLSLEGAGKAAKLAKLLVPANEKNTTKKAKLSEKLAKDSPTVVEQSVNTPHSIDTNDNACHNDVSKLVKQRLKAVENFADIIERAKAVLDDPKGIGRIDDVELIMDGISRLGLDIPASFQGPLLELIEGYIKVLERGYGYSIHQQQLALFLWRWFNHSNGFPPQITEYIKQWKYDFWRWVDGIGVSKQVSIAKLEHADTGAKVDGIDSMPPFSMINRLSRNFDVFIYRRFNCILSRLASGKALPMLSTPTYSYGWICPLTLCDRVLDWKDCEIDDYDGVIALLRLDTTNIATAELAAKLEAVRETVKSEFSEALAYALGLNVTPRGSKPHFWAAASRVRFPNEDDVLAAEHFDIALPDAFLAASYSLNFMKDEFGTSLSLKVSPKPQADLSDQMVASWLLSEFVFAGSRGYSHHDILNWVGTISPNTRQSFFAFGRGCLSDQSAEVVIEFLRDATLPPGKNGLLVLAEALASNRGNVANASRDILANLFESNDRDLELLAQIIRQLLFNLTESFALGWAESLSQVASKSRSHAEKVCTLLERVFSEEIETIPKNTDALLKLLNSLLLELNRKLDEPTRKSLRSIKGNGKAAKQAKAILASLS